MRKFIFGFIIGALLITGVSYAYRAPRPTQLTLPWDDNKIAELNDILEDLWNITNGRYTPNVVTSVPTTAGSEGDMKVYSTGGVYKVYRYLNGGWRVWTSD